MGFFSEVYKGLWREKIVAIKTLSEVTPAALFIREIKVWKSLDHPNVLKLYGASSATGQHPWFFVSPYMKHGTLVQFLKRIAMHQGDYDHGMKSQLGTIVENLPTSRSRSSFGRVCRVLKAGDMYRMMQEVAKGMEYLHDEGILHGDLKVGHFTSFYLKLYTDRSDIGCEYSGRRSMSMCHCRFWSKRNEIGGL